MYHVKVSHYDKLIGYTFRNIKEYHFPPFAGATAEIGSLVKTDSVWAITKNDKVLALYLNGQRFEPKGD